MLGLYWGYIGIMEKKMETTIMGYIGIYYGVCGGSYYNIPKAMFYLLKGDYTYWGVSEE